MDVFGLELPDCDVDFPAESVSCRDKAEGKGSVCVCVCVCVCVYLCVCVCQGVVTYTCCTDTCDRDQSEIKRSSYKIGDDQAIKMSICTAQIKVKMGPVFDSTHAPPTPCWQSTVKALLAVRSGDQGPKMAPIKF